MSCASLQPLSLLSVCRCRSPSLSRPSFPRIIPQSWSPPVLRTLCWICGRAARRPQPRPAKPHISWTWWAMLTQHPASLSPCSASTTCLMPRCAPQPKMRPPAWWTLPSHTTWPWAMSKPLTARSWMRARNCWPTETRSSKKGLRWANNHSCGCFLALGIFQTTAIIYLFFSKKKKPTEFKHNLWQDHCKNF